MKALRKLGPAEFFPAAAIFLSVVLLYLPTVRFAADRDLKNLEEKRIPAIGKKS